MLTDPKVGDHVCYETGTVRWEVKEVIRLRQGRILVAIDLGWRGHERIEDAANLYDSSLWERKAIAYREKHEQRRKR